MVGSLKYYLKAKPQKTTLERVFEKLNNKNFLKDLKLILSVTQKKNLLNHIITFKFFLRNTPHQQIQDFLSI